MAYIRKASRGLHYFPIFLFLCLLVGLIGWLGHETAGRYIRQEQDDEDSLGTVIGIDLGTTYSRVAVEVDGKAEILADEQGYRMTPSCVNFEDGERLIGEVAKNNFAFDPLRMAYNFRRLLGRKSSSTNLNCTINNAPFRVVNECDKLLVDDEVQGKTPTLWSQDMKATILSRLRKIAETHLNKKIISAVVTVPAYLDDGQRQAVKDAGSVAGLNVLRIVNEPTAAAIAYGLDHTAYQDERLIIVYDLGGETLDVSILTIDTGIFEILATASDPHLGGKAFDQRIIDDLVKQYHQEKNLDIEKDFTAMSSLRHEVEKAKRILSSRTSTKLHLKTSHDDQWFSAILNREKFEELNKDLFEKTFDTVQHVLEKANVTEDQIDDIVHIGGSAHIPRVRAIVEDFFGKPPVGGVVPDEAVALGAARQGAILSSAEGVCVQYLPDVTPLSLGIETTGGLMTQMVRRGTSIPTRRSQNFSIAIDDQSTVPIKVFKGERSLTKDNDLLGEFALVGIPSGAHVEISFEIDPDGNTKVGAVEKSTGMNASLIILKHIEDHDWDKTDRKISEAQEFAEEDQRIRARIELENLLFSLEKQAQNTDAQSKTLVKAIRETSEWFKTSREALTEDLDKHKKKLVDFAFHVTGKNLEDIPPTLGEFRYRNGRHDEL